MLVLVPSRCFSFEILFGGQEKKRLIQLLFILSFYLKFVEYDESLEILVTLSRNPYLLCFVILANLTKSL